MQSSHTQCIDLDRSVELALAAIAEADRLVDETEESCRCEHHPAELLDAAGLPAACGRGDEP